MKYFIAENGHPAGPFTPSQLLSHRLTRESLVYYDALDDWIMADNVVELSELLDQIEGKTGKEKETQAQPKAPKATKEEPITGTHGIAGVTPEIVEPSHDNVPAPDEMVTDAAPVTAATTHTQQQQPTPPPFNPAPAPVAPPIIPAGKGQIPYTGNQAGYRYYAYPPVTNKAVAIMAIVIGVLGSCLIAGVVGLILGIMSLSKGSFAQNAYKQGNYIEAEQHAENARKLATLGLVFAIALPIVFCLFFGIADV